MAIHLMQAGFVEITDKAACITRQPVNFIPTFANHQSLNQHTRMVVEVFKTNVKNRSHAKMLVDQIHTTFIDYKANFDLEDCDKILRVASATGFIQSALLIKLLKDFGYNAQVLPDED